MEIETEKLPKNTKQMLVVDETVKLSNKLEVLLEKFTWWKILRITAFVMRFIANCRGKPKQKCTLTSEEIEAAEIYWIKEAQQSEHLQCEIDCQRFT